MSKIEEEKTMSPQSPVSTTSVRF